jgi:hypothetical protein
MTWSEMPFSIRTYITEEIAKAIEWYGLPPGSPLGDVLKANAQVSVGRNPEVLVPDDGGQLVSLNRRLEQMKSDERYRGYFRPEPPKVPRDDWEKLREHFYEIARGEVGVE